MLFHPRKISAVPFLICMFIILLIPIKTPFNAYDEGFTVFNATRVMNGDVPYRDFWAIYPPGQFYLLAAIFKIFGINLLTARIYDIIARLVIVIGVYFIANKTLDRALSLLVCSIIALLLASAGFYTYAVFPSLALGLLSILSLLEAFDTGQRRWLVLTGLLIGVGALFRWDIGLYTSISVISAALLFYNLHSAKAPGGPIRALFAVSRPIAVIPIAALLVALPCYGYLIFKSGFTNLWTQVVVFPMTTLHSVRRLSLPPIIPFIASSTKILSTPRDAYLEFLEWLRLYATLAAYGIVLSYYGLSLLRKRVIFNTTFFATAALIVLGVMLFAQALSRYDSIHILPSSVIALLLVAPLAHRLMLNVKRNTLKNSLLIALGIFAILYLFLPTWIIFRSLSGFSPFHCHARVVRASCIYLDSNQELAVEYIRAHTSDGEAIFVGNQRHDTILVNDIGFYFLSDRPSATKYHELYPGVATTAPVQETIIREIQSRNVRWVILVGTPESSEANASAVSSGVRLLDEFIRSTYAPVAAYGKYEIWKIAPE